MKSSLRGSQPTVLIARVLWRASLLFVLAFLGTPVGAQEGAKADPFGPLRFFVGTWRGNQSGQPGQGTVERTYQFILNDRFLQETNTSTYLPQEKNKRGEVHHHISMISYDRMRKLLVFRQFHTEGFVNTYLQRPATDDKKIVFVSEAIENIPAGYRARETYTILSRDEFIERFEIAEPGKDFELYSEAHLKRAAQDRSPINSPDNPESNENRIIQAERSSDVQVFDQLMAEDAITIGPDGRRRGKAEMIAIIKSMPPQNVAASDFVVVEVTPEAVMVTYTVDGVTTQGVRRRHTASSLWVRRPPGWRMLFHQGTEAPVSAQGAN